MTRDMLPPVREAVEKLRDKRVFFHALPGNNGDRLIQWGSRAVLRDVNATLVDKESEAEAIVLNGGAAISKDWKLGISYVNQCNTHWGNKPLWIFPSTVNVKGLDFEDSFSKRTSSAYFWTRELYSLEMLKRCNFPDIVQIGVDHDMAFQLRNEKFMDDLRAKLSGDFILIVERNDIESPTGFAQKRVYRHKSPLEKTLRGLAPSWLKKMRLDMQSKIQQKKNKALGPEVWRHRSYVEAALERVYADYPDARNLPIRWWDVSREDVCTMQEFLDTVAATGVIVTTRLHVGILGHMLGKRAFVTFGSGLSHKFKGIYEYSLEQDPNVRVLPFSPAETAK